MGFVDVFNKTLFFFREMFVYKKIFVYFYTEFVYMQTCFCQPSRMSHFGELPDMVYQKLLKKFKKKPKITNI